MKPESKLRRTRTISYAVLLCLLFGLTAGAQQTKISDYTIFGGKNTTPPTGTDPASYGVQIGSSNNITGGLVGSYYRVMSTGNMQVNGSIYSGGTINLTNGNTILGRLAAGISPTGVPGTVISTGSNAQIGNPAVPNSGNIDANGSVVVGGGTVLGKVTLPLPSTTYTYSGPTPNGGVQWGTPATPLLPVMPPVTNFPVLPTPLPADITNTATLVPIGTATGSGLYGNISLSGKKSLTFSGTGVYVINSISNSGTTNDFIFDFKGNSTGTFRVYVYGDVDLGKVQASIVNAGANAEARVYFEIHGNGSGGTGAAFSIANGSASKASKWVGTVWAPFGKIDIGSGTGSSDITGALWSGTMVNLQSGVLVNYAAFPVCANPPTADAGPDKTLDFVNPTTLTGSSNSTNVNFAWTATNGGVISGSANTTTITVTSAGTYILKVTSADGACESSDTAIVTGKLTNVIGSELEAVLQNFNAGGTPSPFFDFRSDSIFIDVIVKAGEYSTVKSILTNPTGPWGMTNLLGEDASSYIITGLIAISKVGNFNIDPVILPKIVYVRPYYRAFNNVIYPTGLVTTQGDVAMRANLVRLGYDLSGDGIKIGVLSNSFGTITSATTLPVVSSTAAQDTSSRDLPGSPGNLNSTMPVTVLKESQVTRTDEGRAMLQIIHDVAPKAQLYFRTGVETASDFADGVRELQAAGCDVITDDVTFIQSPFLKDGEIANAVRDVTAAGVTYVTSAGNFASKSVEGAFNPMPAPGGLTGTAHNFSGSTPGDPFLHVTLVPGQRYVMVLQWLDDIYSEGEITNGGTQYDLDLYLTPSTDGSGLFGFNRNNLNGDPIEFLPFTYSGTGSANILIVNNTTTGNPARFKLVVFQGDITFDEYVNGGPTVVGHANVPEALTVGAVRFDKVPPFAGPATVESFSSKGGTVVNGIARNKPDIAGPDGVNTTVNMGPDYTAASDPDNNFSNFFGTSAAAPHVAAVAALVMEGRKRYLAQTSFAPGEIKSILLNSATDIETPGFDNLSGYGFVNADSAMRTFANPDPSLIKLVVPDGTTPGTTPFTLTVTGLNLSPSSTIIFRDSALATNVINSDTATADIPAFIGDPIISVYTPPETAGGLDGGTSDTLRFFSAVKRNVVVSVDNKIKKFGEIYPQLTASITVDDTLYTELAHPLTLTELGLDPMTIQSAVTDVTADVGTYLLTATRDFDPNDPGDIGYQELYNYTFNTGTLTIEKLPVTITVADTTIVYGEVVPNAEFTYSFDGSNMPDSVAFLNSLEQSHQQHLAKDAAGNDILGLVNGQAVAIVNGQAIAIVNGEAIAIVNGEAVAIVNGEYYPIVNGQAITIVNGEAQVNEVDLTQSDIAQLSFQVSSGALSNARTIYNMTLVDGTYVKDSTKVVDITQESILNYNLNTAQTQMLNSVNGSTAKGLIDFESLTNGEAIAIVNGEAIAIVNGEAITIVNGEAVTIVNGEAVTIVNGEAIAIVNGDSRSAVIIDSTEIGQGQNQLTALNMVTGLGVGINYRIPGSLENSNLALTYIAGTITVVPAEVTILPDTAQQKTYGTAADPAFTFTNNAGLTADDFTGSLERESGETAGSYAFRIGTLSAGDDYRLVLAADAPSFTITQQPVTIYPTPGQTKVYGSPDPVFTYTNDASLAPAAFTGTLGRAAGNNAGLYAYTLGTLNAGANYQLSLGGTESFSITKAPLTVKADTVGIDPGDRLPAASSVVKVTGLKNGDAATPVYTTSPTYDFRTSPAGVYTIVPALQSFSAAGNYTITIVNGIMYVNPKGPGAKKLISKLDCVIEVTNPAPGQFRYVAHFTCDNNNATPVYVPIGPNNLLTSEGGSFDGSSQPDVFPPGTITFDVPFDGNKLTWTITTYETNHKSAVASTASSTSGRCSFTTPAARTTTTEVNSISFDAGRAAGVYPNPANNRITVTTAAPIMKDVPVQIFDAQGAAHPVKTSGISTGQSIGLDVSGLAKGIYFIKVQTSDGVQIFRFVRM